jgi:DNA uptake protein ComE-like DNA-binding protein
MLQPDWKSYFLFSKKELKGIVVLGFVLFSSVLIRLFFPSPLGDHKLSTKVNHRLFYFDPNSIDSISAIALGIPERQVKSLLHYREKGGYFKNPDDFARLYGLTPDLFNQLKPYIRMQERKYKYNKDYAGNDYSKDLPDWTLDINKATEADWVAKANLSPLMARRVLAYKNYLGYFTHVQQIKKVYGMSDSLFQSLRSHLRTTDTHSYLLNVNGMQFNDWKQLAMFTDAQIWQILKWKKENGGKLSWTQLVELGDLGEAQGLELKKKLNLSD